MPRLLVALLLLASVGLTFSVSAQGVPNGPREDGAALAQRVYDRPAGDDVSARILMRLHDNRGEPRERVMYSYAKDKGRAERWTLLRFIEPADIAGTGLLTLNYPGDVSDQWLYLPALDRVRRIASTRKGGRFVGSDFFYEDLMDRQVEMDNHRLLGTELLLGVECEVLESTPIEPGNSVYTRRIAWIHPELDLPLRVDFYQNNSEEPVKRLQASEIRRVQGFWTVFDSTMHDLISGHRTQMLTLDIKYNQDLPDELFQQRSLADETVATPFRP